MQPDSDSMGIEKDTRGFSVYHRPVIVSDRKHRMLWRQEENRDWFQRTETGYKQFRNPEPGSLCQLKTS